MMFPSQIQFLVRLIFGNTCFWQQNFHNNTKIVSLLKRLENV